jgi:HEAT repeat protein
VDRIAALVSELRWYLHRLEWSAAATWQAGLRRADVEVALGGLPFHAPPNLITWFTAQDGCPGTLDGEVFPRGTPFSIGTALRRRRRWLRDYGEDSTARPDTLFPLFGNYDIEYSLDCGESERRGQILLTTGPEPPECVMSDLESFLAALVECHARGLYSVERPGAFEPPRLVEEPHRTIEVSNRHRPAWHEERLAILRDALGSGSDGMANVDARAWAWLGSEGAQLVLPHLERALEHDDAIPTAAIDAVCDAPPEAALPSLVHLLGRRTGMLRYERLVTGLRRIGTPQAARALVDALVSPGLPFGSRRQNIAEAFAGWPSEEAADAAVPLLTSEDEDVRRNAATLLGNVQAKGSITALTRALVDPSVEVAAAAAEGLGKLGASNIAVPLIEAFERGLASHFGRLERGLVTHIDPRSLSGAAALAITKLDAPSAAPLLVTIVEDLRKELVQRPPSSRKLAAATGAMFLHVLTRWGHATDPVELGQWLKHTRADEGTDPFVLDASTRLARALVTFADPIAERVTLNWLAALELRSRDGALRQLANASPWAIDLLGAWSLHDDAHVRGGAVFALGDSADEAALQPLVVAADDEVPLVRWEACRSLGRLAAPRAVPALSNALADPNDAVAAAAYEALHTIAPAAARSADVTGRRVLEVARRDLEL